jgi:hypothetical protein
MDEAFSKHGMKEKYLEGSAGKTRRKKCCLDNIKMDLKLEE